MFEVREHGGCRVLLFSHYPVLYPQNTQQSRRERARVKRHISKSMIIFKPIFQKKNLLKTLSDSRYIQAPLQLNNFNNFSSIIFIVIFTHKQRRRLMVQTQNELLSLWTAQYTEGAKYTIMWLNYLKCGRVVFCFQNVILSAQRGDESQWFPPTSHSVCQHALRRIHTSVLYHITACKYKYTYRTL